MQQIQQATKYAHNEQITDTTLYTTGNKLAWNAR